MKLSSSQRLALLHTATVLASLYSEDLANKSKFALLGYLVLACLGFLLIIFQVLPRENALKAIEKQTTSAAASPNQLQGMSSLPVSLSESSHTIAAFNLSITDVRKRNHKTEYRVDGMYKIDQWTAWLRYSELLDLANRIGKVNEFPPKSSILEAITYADQTLEFVDARRHALDRFIKLAVPDCESFEILLNTQPEVRELLGVPESVRVSKDSGKADRGAIVKQALDVLSQVETIAQHGSTRDGGDGWTFHSSRDGIDCFLKRDGNFTYSLGRGPLQAEAKRAMEFMMDLNHRKSWDDMYKFQHVVEDFKPYSFTDAEQGNAEWEILSLQISHSAFSSPTSLVAERDTVCTSVIGRRIRDAALCIALVSVPDARVPEGKDGYVRAKVQCAGFLFEDRQDGRPGCVMSTMGLLDPNGNIPQFVVNTMAPKRAFLIKDINAACVKHT